MNRTEGKALKALKMITQTPSLRTYRNPRFLKGLEYDLDFI